MLIKVQTAQTDRQTDRQGDSFTLFVMYNENSTFCHLEWGNVLEEPMWMVYGSL